MKCIAIIGCGFVADLYMRSFARHRDIRIVAVYDRSEERLEAFSKYWNVDAASDLNALFSALPEDGLVLNLTNPLAHHEINKAALVAGHHVFCEKPLALDYDEALELVELARKSKLQLGSAPSSVLGETAQTLGYALRNTVGGIPRLVYGEMDDGYISQAPIEGWRSESGAAWPFEDEIRTGCTLEHAGYHLSWLIAHFGSVKRVAACSAEIIPGKRGITDAAPDFSVAILEFEGGPIARLTCSIGAPHDHRLRVITDGGVLSISKAWDNSAPVRFHKRMTIRRRLLEHPVGKRQRLPTRKTHPKVSRKGAAAMNFALGPDEMLNAISANRQSRLAGAYALHLTEVTLAIQNAGFDGGAYHPKSDCPVMEPMPWAN